MVKFSAVFLAVILFAGFGVAAYADDDPVSHYVSGEWNLNETPCTYELGEITWSWSAGGIDIAVVSDANPPEGSDPRLTQTVRNQTTDVWTDWHVKVVNGTNLSAISVKKTYDYATNSVVNLAWDYELESYVDGVGFFAHLHTSGDPNNPEAIRQYDKLYVTFTYDIVEGQTASIIQYPTTNYAIPEPSSILALFVGIGGLLGFARRRK
jgi:hypothetical protein